MTGFLISDTIPHDLLLRAVRKHNDCTWVLCIPNRIWRDRQFSRRAHWSRGDGRYTLSGG
jgi:hypothetical protein